MKITKSRLKQIIRETLSEEGNLNLRRTLSGEEVPQEPVVEELTLPNLLMELQKFLDEWEQKEYPSDQARYMGYYTDIQSVVEKYDLCVHPGQSCDEAHQGEEHGECIERMASEKQ